MIIFCLLNNRDLSIGQNMIFDSPILTLFYFGFMVLNNNYPDFKVCRPSFFV